MAGENIVSIIVRALNETGPGLAAAKEEAAGAAGEMDTLAAAEEGAAAKTGLLGGSFAAARTKLESFGTIGGIALAGLGYESVKMGMSFQAAMERLVTQAGVAPSKLDALKAGVLQLAGKVGFSPDSLAESLYHVESNFASLGISAPKALSLVQIAAEGAKVGNANLEDVTNALTAAVASGIPGVKDFSQAMGALNSIVGAGDMKMQDLAEAMGTGVMAVVKGYGLSLKDVGAALDVFGDNNIRGAQAATDLRMAVQSLAVPAAAGKKLLADMGLSMSSLGDTMRQHGLLAALEELQARFKAAGITAKEQGDVITEIFGKKAGVGLAVLMDQLDRLKSKYPAITDGAKNFGKAWSETQQTLSQQWAELRGTFDALMTSIGSKLIPVLSDIAGFLLKNQGIIKALAPVVLALVGAFTALSLVLKAIAIVSDLNPWTLAIMAVIAVTVLLVEHWKEVKRVAEDVWHAVTSAVSTAFDWIKSHWPLILGILTGPIGLAALFIIDHWHQILSGAEDMIHDVVSWFERLPGMILAALGDLASMLFHAGVSAIEGLLHGMESMVGGVIHTVSGWGHDIANGIGSVFGIHFSEPSEATQMIKAGQNIATGLSKGMLSGRSAVQAAANQLSGAAGISPGSGVAAIGTGTGGGDIVFRLGTGGSGLEQMFWTWLKNGVRAQGGDPNMFTRKVKFQ